MVVKFYLLLQFSVSIEEIENIFFVSGGYVFCIYYEARNKNDTLKVL